MALERITQYDPEGVRKINDNFKKTGVILPENLSIGDSVDILTESGEWQMPYNFNNGEIIGLPSGFTSAFLLIVKQTMDYSTHPEAPESVLNLCVQTIITNSYRAGQGYTSVFLTRSRGHDGVDEYFWTPWKQIATEEGAVIKTAEVTLCDENGKGGNHEYARRWCEISKVGNLVVYSGELRLSKKDPTLADTASMEMRGFPYISGFTRPILYTSYSSGFINTPAGINFVQGFMWASDPRVQMFLVNGTVHSNMKGSHISNSTNFMWQLIYGQA